MKLKIGFLALLLSNLLLADAYAAPSCSDYLDAANGINDILEGLSDDTPGIHIIKALRDGLADAYYDCVVSHIENGPPEIM